MAGFGQWQGLAYLAGTTSKETREQIVGAILAATADRRWAYIEHLRHAIAAEARRC